MDDFYKENILDHYRNPRHAGTLADAKTSEVPEVVDFFARARPPEDAATVTLLDSLGRADVAGPAGGSASGSKGKRG